MSGSRPSEFTQEIGDRLCAAIAEGLSLRTICKAEDMPAKSTFFKWLRLHPELKEQYAIAKEESADALVEDILDIADDASNDWMEVHDKDNPGYRLNGEHVQRSRLRVDTRKWYASKLKPKRYGERVQAELTGKDGGPIQTESLSDQEIARRIAFALQAGAKQADEDSGEQA
jgi:hypothetical protein